MDSDTRAPRAKDGVEGAIPVGGARRKSGGGFLVALVLVVVAAVIILMGYQLMASGHSEAEAVAAGSGRSNDAMDQTASGAG